MSARDGVSRLYVGNLPPNMKEHELHDVFQCFGRIIRVTIKRGSAQGTQPFAFIEFEDPRDAEDALKEKDGAEIDGCRLRVEIPFNCRPHGSHSGRPTKGRGVAPRKGRHCLRVYGIPPTGSWQDLKDHMRPVGECMHADVFHDGTGEVSFAFRSELEMAKERLNGSIFRSHEGEKSRITLREVTSRERSRYRSPSYYEDRERSRGRGRGRSRERSRRRRDRYRTPEESYERERSRHERRNSSRERRHRSRSRKSPAYEERRSDRSSYNEREKRDSSYRDHERRRSESAEKYERMQEEPREVGVAE